MTDKTTQLVVIGAGPGGYAAAFLAADLGLEVTLIAPETNPGGVCLYRGCIPSKALLHVARLINETREAQTMGITFSGPQIDPVRLKAWKDEVVNSLTGGLGRLVTQRKVNHIRATAVFQDPQSLLLTLVDGGRSELRFEKAIIATGSYPSKIPGLDSDSPRIWNSKSALDLPDIPKNLLVIGGGYIGLELGTVYAALGSEVTVVEMLPNLLAGVDRDLVRFLQKNLNAKFKQILLETRVAEAKAQEDGVKVSLQDPDKAISSRLFERVLVAVGRRPNTGQLGLAQAGVEVDGQGFIKVNEQRQTSAAHIYAIGDAAGEPMLAHKASHEGRVAVEAVTGRPTIYEPAAVPAVVFTDPEIAWAGLTESQAKAQGRNYEIARFPWAASGRAATLGRSDGLTKLVVDPASERLLGVGIVGPGAGEMIAEAVLAIEMAASVTDIALTIHPHPTLSETFKEAAELFHGTATHYFRPKRKKSGS